MKKKATTMKSRINYLLIVENYDTNEISTAGYRTKKEAIKAVRAERGKYKSDKSYRGDPSGNGECFYTDKVGVWIEKVDSLVRGVGQDIFTVSLCTGDGSLSYVNNFGSQEDAYRYFKTVEDWLKTKMTVKETHCFSVQVETHFEGKDGKTVTLCLHRTVTTRLTEEENKSLKADIYWKDEDEPPICDYDFDLLNILVCCNNYLDDEDYFA